MQSKRIFFDTSGGKLYPNLPSKPSKAKILSQISDDSCPLSKVIVGENNESNMRILRRLAFNAFSNPTHSCKGMSFAIYGGPGQGKTYVAKKWMETIGIPFLLVQSDTLNDTWMLFEMLTELFLDAGTPLEPMGDDFHYSLPPCIIFFDEAHALNSDLRTGGLLPAMEPNDAWLRTAASGKNQNVYHIDCSEVCWVAATTDPGILLKSSSAFYSRFRMHIQWQPAGVKEIAKIVELDNQNKIAKNEEGILPIPEKACEIVAKYVSTPRTAVAFADHMSYEKNMLNNSWEKCAAIVAEDSGIDPFGLPYVIVNLLKELSTKPVSDRNIITLANCRREQFDSEYAPILLSNLKDRGPLAQPTTKGWTITTAGCNELDKRGITHQGRLQVIR